MAEKPTIVVIGSGFGGSVFACRMAERQSATVYVLERGREYGRNQFPRRPDQMREAFWDPEGGKFGMFEYQSFPSADIDVLTASGLGGGSMKCRRSFLPAGRAVSTGKASIRIIKKSST